MIVPQFERPGWEYEGGELLQQQCAEAGDLHGHVSGLDEGQADDTPERRIGFDPARIDEHEPFPLIRRIDRMLG